MGRPFGFPFVNSLNGLVAVLGVDPSGQRRENRCDLIEQILTANVYTFKHAERASAWSSERAARLETGSAGTFGGPGLGSRVGAPGTHQGLLERKHTQVLLPGSMKMHPQAGFRKNFL